VRILSPLLLSVVLISSASAQSAQEARRQEFAELSRKIFASPNATDAERRAVNNTSPAQMEEITGRLHDLVTANLADVLELPNTSPRKITSAVRTMFGEMSLERWGDTTNGPFASFAQVAGTRTLAVAYGMLRGGGAIPASRSYVEFYANKSGKWERIAGISSDFDGCTFFVSPIPAGITGQIWILVWGTRFGDTGSRMRARLYAFYGTNAQTIWRRDELVRGSLKVGDGSVLLEYDREYHSLERVRETLYVQPDGLR